MTQINDDLKVKKCITEYIHETEEESCKTIYLSSYIQSLFASQQIEWWVEGKLSYLSYRWPEVYTACLRYFWPEKWTKIHIHHIRRGVFSVIRVFTSTPHTLPLSFPYTL